jgi:hypothetical protein
MKVTNEIHSLAVEALEHTRHINEELEWIEQLSSTEEYFPLQAHRLLASARSLVSSVQEISNRVAGYAAPRSGE